MIKSIRGRLQWWYGGVYALSIVVFGSLVYWRADRDVHERATLQAVSTAQYLDVSLRNLPPGFMPDAERENLPVSGDRTFPPQDRPVPGIGQLPPEFRFRPPRERDNNGRPDNGRPDNGRPDNGRPDNGRPDNGRPDSDLNGRPFRGPPDGNRDRRPPGSFRPGDPEPNSGAGLRPESDSGPERPPRDRRPDEQNNVRPQRRMDPMELDRMEYVIWRPDGSMLSHSDEFSVERPRPKLDPAGMGGSPQVSMNHGQLEVLKRGPHGTMILVLRSIRRDMADLYQFGLQIAIMALGTLLLGLLGGWWISGRMVQPIRKISETASQISATSLNRRIETDSLEQELVQLGLVLNGTFARLENSFSRLTQFTADASHELRTPLAVIQSQAELALSRPRTSEAYQQTLEICLQSAGRMRSLIDGLLLLARTDSERLDLRPRPLDLRHIAEDAVSQFQRNAVDAGVELECVSPESPVMVSGDGRFLAQIPANLIDNAIQHSVTGGKITVEVRLEETDAVLTVQDSGSGIAAEHLPYLFERFYRIDAGRSRQHGGSGLGLAICKNLVEVHGGTIQCESTPGKGSLFTVRIPVSKTVSVTQQVHKDA